MNFDDYPEDEIDEKQVTVTSALQSCAAFTYEYDFGDGWGHQVIVEKHFMTTYGLKFGVCVDGANACPPEDCGGPWGYANMLEAIGNPKHDEHEQFVQWLGGPFDSTAFDLAATNAALQKVK